MVDKISSQGRPYRIDGRAIIWQPEDDEGVRGSIPEVRLPLRVKMGVVLKFAERDMDNAVMAEMVRALVPNAAGVLDEMDVNDFQDMFSTWQSEYNSLTGGSLGESSSSSASSPSTEPVSSTTGAPASV